jgi:hypothetical protein
MTTTTILSDKNQFYGFILQRKEFFQNKIAEFIVGGTLKDKRAQLGKGSFNMLIIDTVVSTSHKKPSYSVREHLTIPELLEDVIEAHPSFIAECHRTVVLKKEKGNETQKFHHYLNFQGKKNYIKYPAGASNGMAHLFKTSYSSLSEPFKRVLAMIHEEFNLAHAKPKVQRQRRGAVCVHSYEELFLSQGVNPPDQLKQDHLEQNPNDHASIIVKNPSTIEVDTGDFESIEQDYLEQNLNDHASITAKNPSTIEVDTGDFDSIEQDRKMSPEELAKAESKLGKEEIGELVDLEGPTHLQYTSFKNHTAVDVKDSEFLSPPLSPILFGTISPVKINTSALRFFGS